MLYTTDTVSKVGKRLTGISPTGFQSACMALTHTPFIHNFIFLTDLFIFIIEKVSKGRSIGRGTRKGSEADFLLTTELDMGLDFRTLRSWSYDHDQR